MEQWRRSRVAGNEWLVSCLLLGLGAFLSTGCSSHHQAFVRVVTPHPPAFLTGPASVLLTNSPGFGAHLEVQSQGSLPVDHTSSGQLLARGAKLLYAPETEEATDTHQQRGGYSFIWDVAESRGYVLSEALQGYAPVSAVLRVTNVAVEPEPALAQRLAGHPGEPAHATVSMSDGSSAGFELLRAIDLNGLPVRIESATNASVFTLNLSKVRFEQPKTGIFAPPDGFTKYATPEAMADELAARLNNLRRKAPDLTQPLQELQRGPRY